MATTTSIPHGRGVLRDPRLNRGTAFTVEEREALGLGGLLPAAVLSLDEQATRSYAQYLAKPTDLAKNEFLEALHDRNEVLYYRLLEEHLEGEELERARRFYRHCADNDLAVCVGQTDAKGDRSKGPSEQDDPDMYMRVVSTNSDGIVVRGAKCHTSVSVNADEIIVLPTRAMSATDADYAVSFAVPLNTKGLKLFVSSYAGGERNDFEFPLSSKHKMLETLTVFDDVFVPWERVFLYREPELAGRVSLGFVEFHRFTAVSYKLPLLDALVGTAALIAEMPRCKQSS